MHADVIMIMMMIFAVCGLLVYGPVSDFNNRSDSVMSNPYVLYIKTGGFLTHYSWTRPLASSTVQFMPCVCIYKQTIPVSLPISAIFILSLLTCSTDHSSRKLLVFAVLPVRTWIGFRIVIRLYFFLLILPTSLVVQQSVRCLSFNQK